MGLSLTWSQQIAKNWRYRREHWLGLLSCIVNLKSSFHANSRQALQRTLQRQRVHHVVDYRELRSVKLSKAYMMTTIMLLLLDYDLAR